MCASGVGRDSEDQVAEEAAMRAPHVIASKSPYLSDILVLVGGVGCGDVGLMLKDGRGWASTHLSEGKMSGGYVMLGSMASAMSECTPMDEASIPPTQQGTPFSCA